MTVRTVRRAAIVAIVLLVPLALPTVSAQQSHVRLDPDRTTVEVVPGGTTNVAVDVEVESTTGAHHLDEVRVHLSAHGDPPGLSARVEPRVLHLDARADGSVEEGVVEVAFEADRDATASVPHGIDVIADPETDDPHVEMTGSAVGFVVVSTYRGKNDLLVDEPLVLEEDGEGYSGEVRYALVNQANGQTRTSFGVLDAPDGLEVKTPPPTTVSDDGYETVTFQARSDDEVSGEIEVRLSHRFAPDPSHGADEVVKIPVETDADQLGTASAATTIAAVGSGGNLVVLVALTGILGGVVRWHRRD